MSQAAALAALAAMGLAGVAALRRVAAFLTPLELIAYGFPLGVVGSSLGLLLLADKTGLRGALVLVVAATIALCTVSVLAEWRRAPRASRTSRRAWSPASHATVWAFVVLGALVVRWAFMWWGALRFEHDGLWAGHRNLWADWAQHLGDVSSFAFGDNFPPAHPRFAGGAFAYHYLSSLTVAAMVELGVEPTIGLRLHSFVFSVLLTLAVFVFVRRWTADTPTATLTVVLFLLGGGWGFWLTATEIASNGQPLGTLLRHPWDQEMQQAANFRWLNVVFGSLAPQRAFLYGLPMSLLCLAVLRQATRERRWGGFVLAGLVAGLLPFAHLGSLLALALITPCLVPLFPARGWAAFVGTAALLAAPQLWLQQGGEPGALAALRIAPGWVAAPDPWVWFWLKNLGAFWPLLLVALVSRSVLEPPARRFVLGCMPIFALANLFVFQPWDWDNSKVLVYWFLGVTMAAAAVLVHAWRRHPALAARAAIGLLVLSMTLSGLLEHLQQLRGLDRHRLLTPDELRLARDVRESTEASTLFAVGLQHNHPIPMLAGRRVVMGYPGWLYSHGIRYSRRESDLREIFALSDRARGLLQSYGIDYVVIGPRESEDLAADAAAYRRRYPVAIRTRGYEVFAVSAAAKVALTASSVATDAARKPRE